MSDKLKDGSFSEYANQLVQKYLEEPLKKSEPSNRNQVALEVMDSQGIELSPLVKSILNVIDEQNSSFRVAFEVDPVQRTNYKGIWEPKINVLPDVLLKRMAVTDDLLATIVTTRINQISRFCRPRPDRLSMGFVIEPRPDTVEAIKKEKDLKSKDKRKKN